MSYTKRQKRIVYLENLKILLTGLVILHHVAIAYGPPLAWYYTERSTSLLTNGFLGFIVSVNQSFFLGLFFFISGYLTPASYNRKGPQKFLRDRLVRLGIPFVIYNLTVNLYLWYLKYTIIGQERLSFAGFIKNCLPTGWCFYQSPLWFVEALLIFALLYLVFNLLNRQPDHLLPKRYLSHRKSLSVSAIWIFIIFLAFITFLLRIFYPIGTAFVNLQIAYLPQYISSFILGIMAYRYGWLKALKNSLGRIFGGIAIAFAIMWPILLALGGGLSNQLWPFRGGFSWQSLAYSLWETIVGFGTAMGLLILFRIKFNSQTKISQALANSAYAIFIVHSPTIVFLQYLFRPLFLTPFLKFIIVATIGLPLSFLSGYIIRKAPIVNKII